MALVIKEELIHNISSGHLDDDFVFVSFKGSLAPFAFTSHDFLNQAFKLLSCLLVASENNHQLHHESSIMKRP